MLNHERPIVVIGEPGTEDEAIMRLGRIGYDNVVGFLQDGMEALRDRPELVRTIDRITAVALFERMSGKVPPIIIDVRSEKQWRCGHIAGSRNVPLNQLKNRLDELPRDRPVVVHCEGGYRSAIAASVLTQSEFDDVFDLVGGFRSWGASHLAVRAEEVNA